MENNNQKQVTFEDIENNEEINEYITKGNEYLGVMNYTEHGFAHLKRSAVYARRILEDLGYDERTCELAAIAGYMHDIGNVVNRVDHAQSGAIMAFQILTRMGMPPSEISQIIAAIDIHDRVNYAVEHSSIEVNKEQKVALLKLTIDTTICPVIEYFEIFLTRMVLCRKAADFLGLTFQIVVNDARIL